MKILGIITEYNPFHKGHAYHIRESVKITGADRVICVMSGNFVQRGEPALINKWARAEIALKNGADLVLELPAVFSAASAEYFAFGALSILNSTGITDCLSFGSESGELSELTEMSRILSDESDEYKVILKKYLSSGFSYPKARDAALSEYTDCASAASLKLSNNILGIEYLKALYKLKSPIVPFTIKRIGSGYNDEDPGAQISSATAIRKALLADTSPEDIRDIVSKHIPSPGNEIVAEEIINGRFATLEKFDKYLMGTLRSMSKRVLLTLPYISEGLENRIIKCAGEARSITEFLTLCQTSRYPMARIRRIVTSILTGVTARDLHRFSTRGAPYIKVLGFNLNGRELLSQMSAKASVPVITKPAHLKSFKNRNISRAASIEASSTDIYTLAYKTPEKSGFEYTQNPVIIK